MSALRASLFPASDEPLTPLLAERGHVSYSIYQNVSIAVWVGQATLQVVNRVLEVTKTMVGRFPGGHSSVSFVLDGLPAPTPEAQAQLQKTFSARSQLVVTAIVLEGSGFWASGLRGMINNSHREAQGKSALKIVTSVDPLVGAFCEEHGTRTGVEISPMVLRDVLLHARQVGEKAAREGWEAVAAGT
jgi:hypothetical protein